MEKEDKDLSNVPVLTHPWCGGCGHNFFREPMIPEEVAREQAKTRRCHYCFEDEENEKKKVR